jgi:hypothetical protein
MQACYAVPIALCYKKHLHTQKETCPLNKGWGFRWGGASMGPRSHSCTEFSVQGLGLHAWGGRHQAWVFCCWFFSLQLGAEGGDQDLTKPRSGSLFFFSPPTIFI